jgi:hypothetical protein
MLSSYVRRYRLTAKERYLRDHFGLEGEVSWAAVMASRKAGLSAAVSDIALMVLKPMDASLAHKGINPHRTSPNVRFGSFLSWRTIGTFCVGAMFP